MNTRRSYDDKPCEKCGGRMKRIYFYHQSSFQKLVTTLFVLSTVGMLTVNFMEDYSRLSETLATISMPPFLLSFFGTMVIEERKPRTYRCIKCLNIRQKPPFVYQSENFQSLVHFFFIILGLVGIALVWMLYSL